MNNELNGLFLDTPVMSTIRIDSIYDVSLSKLLLDKIEGLRLSSPSKEVQEFLGQKHNLDIHDVDINDMDQRVGVQLQGERELVKKVANVLSEELPHVVIHQQTVQKDAIYLGTINRVTRKNLVFIDLGDTQAILFGARDKGYTEGDQIIVQVKELPSEPDKLPVCSEQINLSGDYVILEKSWNSNFVRVSKKITGPARERLHEIGKRLKPKQFGVIMRTSAADASEEDIAEEAKMLLEKWRVILAEKKEVETKQIAGGNTIFYVNFCYQTKLALDRILEGVTKTVPNYHSLKSYSLATNYALEFGSHFITDDNIQKMRDVLYSMILEKDYKLESYIKVNFVKITGTHTEEGLGSLKEIQTDNVMVCRQVMDKRRAEEDMSNYVLFENDYINVYLAEGSWTMYYQYYAGDTNELIGERVRIVAPLDLEFKGKFRAVEFGVELYKPNEEGSTVDIIKEEKLSEMVNAGTISKETMDKIEGIITEVKRRLLEGKFAPIIIRT